MVMVLWFERASWAAEKARQIASDHRMLSRDPLPAMAWSTGPRRLAYPGEHAAKDLVRTDKGPQDVGNVASLCAAGPHPA